MLSLPQEVRDKLSLVLLQGVSVIWGGSQHPTLASELLSAFRFLNSFYHVAGFLMHLLFTLLYFGLDIKRLLLIETLEPKLFRHDGLYSQQGAMGSYLETMALHCTKPCICYFI